MKKIISIISLLFCLTIFGQKFVTPEDCGYTGDSAHFYIQKALDSTGACKLLCHNYPITKTVYIRLEQILDGHGQISSISTLSDITMLKVVGDNCTISNLELAGNGITQPNQIAIGIEGSSDLSTTYSGVRIDNVMFQQLGKAGLYVKNNVSSSTQGTATLVKCKARGCSVGVWLDQRGEYCEFVNCDLFLCLTGIRIKGGNNNFTGGNIASNGVGVDLIGGTNDGHCNMVGSKINHNTTAIKACGIANGYLFNGCDIHAGKINIINSSDIKFKGCTINIDSVKNGTSSGTVFKVCEFTTTPKFTGNTPKFFTNDFLQSPPADYTETLLNPSVQNGKYIYFYGNETTDGAYRIGMNNDSYVIGHRVAGNWETWCDFTEKTFPDSYGRSFWDVEQKQLKDNSGNRLIRLNSKWILSGSYLRYDWDNQFLYDNVQVLSGSFIDRTLNTNSGGVSLDWQNKRFHGDWKIQSPNGTWFKIKVDNSGNLYTE